MKLLISLCTATILMVAPSQAVLIEAGEGAENTTMFMTISQDVVFTTPKPATNANTCFVIEDVRSENGSSMNFATAEALHFQVNEGDTIYINAREDQPNYDSADNTSIYDSYNFAHGLSHTDDLYSLKLNDTVKTSSGTSTVAEVVVINDLLYDPNFQHFPSGDKSMFISGGNSKAFSDVVSAPKPPTDTPPRLASSVYSPFNVFMSTDERRPLLKSSPLDRPDGSRSLR